MDRKRQKLTPGKNDVQKECQDAKMTALERKLEDMENKLKLIDVQKECQDEKITALERKFEHMENKLKLVIAELEQVKEERARDKINFETEKCELESKIDKYKEQCTELQTENKRLQKYFQNLESANTNVEEKSQKTLTYNTDITSQITEVNESNDDVLNINSLPNEIILKIFGYLEQNQLGQIARVCRRWNMLIKSPVLWKKVNVKFSPSHRCQTTVAEYFINTLPSCVTSIRLDFTKNDNWIGTLDYAELCVKLKEKCPNIKVLILTDSALSDSIPSVIDVCSELQDVKSLAFHRCIFPRNPPRVEFSGISKTEVLDLSYCDFRYFNKPHFSRMPCLKVLCLEGSFYIGDSFFEDISFLNQLHVLNVGFTQITAETFPAIQNHGHNLKELYLCLVDLQDHNLTFTDSVFPYLKTICLGCTYMTYESVVSLIQSCPSLENCYIDKCVARFFAHPFVVANRCKSGIVKAIRFDHSHDVDYLDINVMCYL